MAAAAAWRIGVEQHRLRNRRNFAQAQFQASLHSRGSVHDFVATDDGGQRIPESSDMGAAGQLAVTSYLGLVSLLLYAWHERGKPRKSYVVYWYGLEGPPQRETWHDWVDKQWAKFRGRPDVGRPGVEVSVRSCQHVDLAAAQAHFDALVTPPSLPGTLDAGVTRGPLPCIKVLISPDGQIMRWPEALRGCLPFLRLCHVLGRAVQDKALQLPPGTYYGWWYVAVA